MQLSLQFIRKTFVIKMFWKTAEVWMFFPLNFILVINFECTWKKVLMTNDGSKKNIDIHENPLHFIQIVYL